MAKFKPFHVLTGSGEQEIGNSPYGVIHVSGYDGTASVLLGFIGVGEVFHQFQDSLAAQTAPFNVTVEVGKGIRFAVQYTGDVTLSIAEV